MDIMNTRHFFGAETGLAPSLCSKYFSDNEYLSDTVNFKYFCM